MAKAFQTLTIDDDYDHTFACQSHDGRILVRWRNKQAEIQLCGSGAFALIFLLRQQGVLFPRLHTRHCIVAGREHNGHIELKLPRLDCIPVQSTADGKLYSHPESGVMLLAAKSLQQLEQRDWLASNVYAEIFDKAHGFCVFYWNNANLQGSLRYFVPWYGRDEDYVSGSIHRYLTPLIDSLYQPEQQHWLQASSSPGILSSHCDHDSVFITGQCKVVSAQTESTAHTT